MNCRICPAGKPPSKTTEELKQMQTPDAVSEEDKKMRRLRIIVDLTAGVLAQERLTVDEALDLINATRKTVLRLFPGKEETFDVIYGRRFARILRERFAFARPNRGAAEDENR